MTYQPYVGEIVDSRRVQSCRPSVWSAALLCSSRPEPHP